MKSTFGLLRQAQLGLISLLPMVVACIRNAPRYEPKLPIPSSQKDATNSTIGPTGIQETNKNISKDVIGCASILDKLIENHSNIKYINTFLKEIGWSKDLTIKDDQDQSSRPIPNTPLNRSFLFFERHRKDGAWYEHTSIEPESIIMRSNPLLPYLEKHTYALIGFLVDIPEEVDIPEKNDLKDPLIVFVKKDQQWYYYSNDYNNKTDLSTTEAMRLASERGIIFFYRKGSTRST